MLRLLEHMELLNRRLRFNFALKDLQAACLLDPELGTASSETVLANVAGLSRLLSLTPRQLKPVLLTHPSLFRRSPAAVHGNLHAAAAALGMAPRVYLGRVLKV